MTSSTPLEISRSSSSPQHRSSNLTTALQQQHQHAPPSLAASSSDLMDYTASDPTRLSFAALRQDSLVPGTHTSGSSSAARPISVQGQRLESAAHPANGSFAGGMSWGGLSVGSWIQDDIMTGTSPAANMQSPSFHSSSYLPKMEANFWNNLRCCDTGFSDLHELLQHFETVHHQTPSNFPGRMSLSGNSSASRMFGRKPSSAGSGFSPLVSESMKPTQHVRGFQPLGDPKPHGSPLRHAQDSSSSFRKSSLAQVQDMDPLDDMELDDDTSSATSVGNGGGFGGFHQGDPGHGTTSPPAPPLNTGLAQLMKNHDSNPTTPTAANPGLAMNNNPMVSSVNTPTLGTPTALPHGDDLGGGDLGGINANMPFNQQMMQHLNNDFGALDFAPQNGSDMLDLCINDPAKKLFSNEGAINASQFPQFSMMNGNGGASTAATGGAAGAGAGAAGGAIGGGGGGDNDSQRQLQAQQLAAARARLPGEEDRPFKCPVIGCEKAYKNANGLRYHEKHGHSTQKLKDNGDGSFSIVDPVTSLPYPGTVGMEKEKPYRCEVCGKRYKNLNGLKYHRNHSPPCNPDFNYNNVALPGMQPPSMNGDTVF